ncbi:MAG TPA: class I SAM-dependent methyltransferase, partial [Ktedonobacterales bacterium]|nr:class I SAM-dependent methyltransferase [Ktedonobacterales bacterium]
MASFNPLDHPVCLSFPERIADSTWTQHVPFGMLLVDLLRPRQLVELGAYRGTSYCGFCQAVADLKVECRCYAVDTWEGDEQSGFYGPEILADLRTHHDARYETFSRLIQATFDDARPMFADGAIDLLHIDGYHTYESVKHDFENWLPAMSERGVVIFHDIAERQADFGVWRLWDELKARYPSLEFYHGHGLGLIAVGSVIPEGLRALLDTPENEWPVLRTFFFQLGKRIETRQHELALAEYREFVDRQMEEKERILSVYEAQLNEAREQARGEREQSRVELDQARLEGEQLRRECEQLRLESELLRRECEQYRLDYETLNNQVERQIAAIRDEAAVQVNQTREKEAAERRILVDGYEAERQQTRERVEAERQQARERAEAATNRINSLHWQLSALESLHGMRAVKLAHASRVVLKYKGSAALAKHVALWTVGKRGYYLRDIAPANRYLPVNGFTPGDGFTPADIVAPADTNLPREDVTPADTNLPREDVISADTNMPTDVPRSATEPAPGGSVRAEKLPKQPAFTGVSIVIPVFNALEYTKACVDSLYRVAGATPFEVIVVDNGSRP